MVEKIEGIRTEHESVFLGDVETLGNREVHIRLERATVDVAHGGTKARCAGIVAVRNRHWVTEEVWVDIVVEATLDASRRDSCQRISRCTGRAGWTEGGVLGGVADRQRCTVHEAICPACVAIGRREHLPALECDQSTDAPTLERLAPEHAALGNRNLITVRNG